MADHRMPIVNVHDILWRNDRPIPKATMTIVALAEEAARQIDTEAHYELAIA
jgi:hypothetical protein